MGLFGKREQVLPLSEFIPAALQLFDFSHHPKRTDELLKSLGDVPDPDKAVFEWLLLDAVVATKLIGAWLFDHGPDVRSQAYTILKSHCATFLVQHFPRIVDESNVEQVIEPRLAYWRKVLSDTTPHRTSTPRRRN